MVNQESFSTFPDSIRNAHKHSSNHRAEIMESSICGCFYCVSLYPPEMIKHWVDEDSNGQGQTARCPRCGIDSVIGDKSGFAITVEFLTEMRAHWF